MNRPLRCVLACLVFSGVASSQEYLRATDFRELVFWRATEVPAVDPGARPAPLQLRAPDPVAEDLGALLTVEPVPVAREALEGDSEGMHRFRSLPGGIVLGLEASVPSLFEGARLEIRADGELGLRLAPELGGGWLGLPRLEPTELRACALFVHAGLDGLVDIQGGDGRPRLAHEFLGTRLGETLVRMDRLPHRVLPETRAWKTVIVDRAVRARARGEEIELQADLEVRCYDAATDGWARRMHVLEASSEGFVGPRSSTDLGEELLPLERLAGWLGFLRWLERSDPGGFAALADGALSAERVESPR